MTWMLRVVASFRVIEPFQHQLGCCCCWKELSLQQVCHGVKKSAHQNASFKEISLPVGAFWLYSLLQNRLLFCS